ncbi:MAG: hypothetical protein R3E08_05440 [Thiotrichaceae bacterium]
MTGFLPGGSRNVGSFLSSAGDTLIIDGIMVNGSAKLVAWFAGTVRYVQTGLLYHYAFWRFWAWHSYWCICLYGSKVI